MKHNIPFIIKAYTTNNVEDVENDDDDKSMRCKRPGGVAEINGGIDVIVVINEKMKNDESFLLHSSFLYVYPFSRV